MNKIYEKPVLIIEKFDVEDIITESSGSSQPGNVPERGRNWEIDGLELFG